MEPNLKNYDLTDEELLFYANQSLIEICDLCGNFYGFDDIKLIGNKFLCKKCNKQD